MNPPAVPRNSRLPGAPDLEAATAGLDQPWSLIRQTLRPDYGRAWRDMATCYLGLAVGTGGVALVQAVAGPAALLLLPAGVVLTGFWMSSLVRFMHEGAHHNLHPSRPVNDSLCNWLVCGWVFDEVDNYRQVHWQHHLHLGSTEDTEVSYFHAPTDRFLLGTLTGAYVLRVMWRRVFAVRTSTGRLLAPATPRSPLRKALVLARTVALHLGLLALLLWAGAWVAAATWALAMWAAYPFFDVLRQVLEHRRVDLAPDADLAATPHGPNNRLFGRDRLSRWFGNAGFNDHLLHHWDPGISYTRLPDMEAVLLQTPLRDELEAARTTYLDTFRALRAAARG